MPRKKSDPLLAALIAKLPADGTDWPVDKQMAWLNLMAMAFATVYGGNAAERLAAVEKPAQSVASVVASASPAPSKPAKPKYPFIIDEQGFAKKASGIRILPADVTDILYDLRGIDGDMNTIVWADESTGLNGRDLTIAAA
jgi:hypothetical protein